MSKRVIKRIVIAACLVALAAFAYGFFESQKSLIESAYYYWIVSDSKPEPNPNLLRDYPESKRGFYQFDPHTILASLDRGKTDVFTPLLVDPNTLDVYYPGIAWTQSDFLRVATALSQKIWNEPLDLNGWDIFFIMFEGDCNDNFGGFDSFGITYYKTIRTGWETVYTARHIGVTPWMGVAEWEGDGDFSIPFIFGWKNIELKKFKTTAEQSVRIANASGEEAAQLNSANKCNVYVDIDENVNRNTGGNWLVYYHDFATPAIFSLFVNPFTGDVYSPK